MKDLKLDPGQLAAYNADLNAVVSAGAGSGKTTVLAERYVRLVTERGLDVDSILTLTFTRKAASEMYARIYSRLSESDHPRSKAQLAAFDTARIMTLDAFCANVARGACHRYGVPPDFVVDEARLQRIADEAAVEVLMDRREEDALRRLVATRGFDRVRRDFLVDIAVRSISLTKPPAFENDVRRQITYLEARIGSVCAEIERIGADIVSIDETGSSGITLPKAKESIRKVLPLPRSLDGDALNVLAEAGRFLNSKDAYTKPRADTKQNALVLLRELTDPLRENAKELRLLAEGYRFRDDALAVGRLLDDFAGRFLQRKRREGLISFHDAAELAVDILTRDLALRAHYKNRIRAIMIDEFQDDNELQKNLLYLLAERDDSRSVGIPRAEDLAPDKLFFVGDEKQSIYRFRGADVSVFRRLSSELDPGGRAALSLSVNYRSSAELVAFFNAFFPGVFGPAEEQFEAAFSPIASGSDAMTAIAVEPVSPASDQASETVEFHILVRGSETEGSVDEDDAELSAAASEAFAAARRISLGVARDEFTYSDVAVLFRSTSRQHEYERAFRLLEVPFVAADPRGVFAEGPANDIYAMLRLALFPRDRTSYASVLRSPFVRLGDDSLVNVFLAERGNPFPEDADETWFSGPEDALRFAHGRKLYRSVLDSVDRMGTAAVIASLWYDAGYRTALLGDKDAAVCLGHFEYLYNLALDADRRGLCLGAFLDELAPLMGTSEKTEGGDPGEDAMAVRLMTVHKSKGLEFPVVVIADAGNDGRGLRNSLPYYIDPEFGVAVTFRPEDAARDETVRNYFFERARVAAEARETAELRRLLYVAATRAERKLIIFGSRKVTKKESEDLADLTAEDQAKTVLRTPRFDKDGNIQAKSFLDLTAAGLSTDSGRTAYFSVTALAVLGERERRRLARDPALRTMTEARKDGNGRRAVQTRLDDFFARATPQIPEEPRRKTSPSAMEMIGQEENGPFAAGRALSQLDVDMLLKASEMEKAFGTLCHWAIEQRLSGRRDDIPIKIQGVLESLADADRASIINSAKRLAEGFLDSELGRSALAAERRSAEFQFLLALPNGQDRPRLVNGTMDLIFEMNSRCVIVDFKTDRRLEPAAHSVQLAAYRAAAKAFSAQPVETWLFYMRDAFAVRIDEDLPLDRLADLAAKAAALTPASEEE